MFGVAWIPQENSNIKSDIFLHYLYLYIFIKTKKNDIPETMTE